jgi:DNA polymerase-3 subunit chi
MAGFERVFNLFDGRSEAQVAQARNQWQAWRGMEGVEMRYFAQDDEGKWQQRA